VQFQKFRRRALRFSLIKSTVFALSLGTSLFALLHLLAKRELIGISTPIAIGIGLGAALLLFGVLLFLLLPTGASVARELDATLSLGERVATMVAFEDQEGALLTLQREDTNERLSHVPLSALRYKRLPVTIAAVALACSLLIGALAVPALADTPPEDVIVDDYEKDWRIASLLALIERIEKDTYAEAPLKDSLKANVNDLIDAVRETDKEAQMKAAAILAVRRTSALRQTHVSAYSFASAMAAREVLKPLARALKELDDEKLSEAIEDLCKTMTSADAIASFLDVFSLSLTESGINTATDPLTKALHSFADALRTVADTGGGKSEAQDAADALCALAFEILLQQSDNDKLIVVVESEIVSLFGITSDELLAEGVEPPKGSGDATDTPTTEPDDDITPGAGYGKGDKIAGTEDTVYDPDQKESVGLATIVDKYYAKFDSMMDTLSEELRALAEKYFHRLNTPEEYLPENDG
jgi:hypothetical protein